MPYDPYILDDLKDRADLIRRALMVLACVMCFTLAAIGQDIPKPVLVDLNETSQLRTDILRRINLYSDQYGLTNLKDASLGEDESEVRIWVGFGLFAPRCFSFGKIKDKFEANFVSLKAVSGKTVVNKMSLLPVGKDWKIFDEYLNKHPIFEGNLTADKEHIADPDEEIIFVEIKQGKTYTFFHYSISTTSKDGILVVGLGEAAEKEFGISLIL